MKLPQRELKIIAKITEQDGYQILSSLVQIYLDDEQIGVIQDFKFHANADNPICDVEITFPNLKYKGDTNYCKVITSIDKAIEKFKSIIGVKVNLK